jgi:hypothetical protein
MYCESAWRLSIACTSNGSGAVVVIAELEAGTTRSGQSRLRSPQPDSCAMIPFTAPKGRAKVRGFMVKDERTATSDSVGCCNRYPL